MTDDKNPQEAYEAPVPNTDLKTLNRLVGTWELSGDATGRVTYEWRRRVRRYRRGFRIYGSLALLRRQGQLRFLFS